MEERFKNVPTEWAKVNCLAITDKEENVINEFMSSEKAYLEAKVRYLEAVIKIHELVFDQNTQLRLNISAKQARDEARKK